MPHETKKGEFVPHFDGSCTLMGHHHGSLLLCVLFLLSHRTLPPFRVCVCVWMCGFLKVCTSFLPSFLPFLWVSEWVWPHLLAWCLNHLWHDRMDIPWNFHHHHHHHQPASHSSHYKCEVNWCIYTLRAFQCIFLTTHWTLLHQRFFKWIVNFRWVLGVMWCMGCAVMRRWRGGSSLVQSTPNFLISHYYYEYCYFWYWNFCLDVDFWGAMSSTLFLVRAEALLGIVLLQL